MATHEHVLLILGGGFMLIGKGPLAECDDCPASAREESLVNDDGSAYPLRDPAILLTTPTPGGVGFVFVPLPAPSIAVEPDNVLVFQPIDGQPMAVQYLAVSAGLVAGSRSVRP